MPRFFPILLLSFVHLFLFVGCESHTPTGPEEAPGPQHDVGDLVIDLPNGVKMAFIWIEPGSFMMGADPSESSYGEDKPQHEVTLTKGFYMAKYELVWQQWMSIMGKEPDSPWYQIFEEDYPVGIGRYEIVGFLDKLNDLTRGRGLKFRMPTEAEWEYACRAGTAQSYSWGNEANYDVIKNYAWYTGNTYQEKYPHMVGQKKPNPWGLYDMHGNRSEQVEDWFSKYSPEPQVDPVVLRTSDDNPSFGGYVIRGGFYDSDVGELRCAFRFFAPSGSGGFRVVVEKNE